MQICLCVVYVVQMRELYLGCSSGHASMTQMYHDVKIITMEMWISLLLFVYAGTADTLEK